MGCADAGKQKDGGGGGIRTPDTLTRIPVFKTGAFNHSATPPAGDEHTDKSQI